MRILYGVQTTGRGHIMRAREMVKGLKSRGHEVLVLFSGRDPQMAAQMTEFHPFIAHKGLTFVTERGRLKYLKTAFQLDLLRFYRDVYQFDDGNFDLVISDYEPISARIARHLHVPSVGIGHQYAFVYPIPMKGDTFFTRLIMNQFAPVDQPIGLHWHHFDQPICPPIITDAMPQKQNVVEDKILVYLPFESLDDIIESLRYIRSHTFYIYTHEVKEKCDELQLRFRPLSRENFLNDLVSCAGVISNAGFSSISEALHLGKKILVKPLNGQLEQESNAEALRVLNIGHTMDCLHSRDIRLWLQTEYTIDPLQFPPVVQHLVQWIDDGCTESLQTMTKRSWNPK